MTVFFVPQKKKSPVFFIIIILFYFIFMHINADVFFSQKRLCHSL